MRRYRFAKIVATLGPSSNTYEKIAELFKAGVDSFRLNFSHGSHEDHQQIYEHIRKAEKEFDRPIGIIADLQGPKLRIGKLKDQDVFLKTGEKFVLDKNDEDGDETRAFLPHPELFEALNVGDELLIFDGKIRLNIEAVTQEKIETTVAYGGRLTSFKGVNVPKISLPLTALTDKDKRDMAFALDLGVDWVALSFVQRPEDIIEAKNLIDGRAKIITKLEKPSIVKHLDKLIELSDGIMIARGDLGVEIPAQDVPPLQKMIVRAAREQGKPVIVATQMLDSMVRAPAPTRAEASDVANAIYEGADAVMLSEETAAGNYPMESVEMMDKIITSVEKDEVYRAIMHAFGVDNRHTEPDAITLSASSAAKSIEARAIVTYTTSGGTAVTAARQRPTAPILGITGDIRTARYLSLVWGVHSVHTHDARTFDEMIDIACHVAYEQEFAKQEESIVIIAGTPFGTKGATNVLRIAQVEDRHTQKQAA